jgi:hypothetical protein
MPFMLVFALPLKPVVKGLPYTAKYKEIQTKSSFVRTKNSTQISRTTQCKNKAKFMDLKHSTTSQEFCWHTVLTKKIFGALQRKQFFARYKLDKLQKNTQLFHSLMDQKSIFQNFPKPVRTLSSLRTFANWNTCDNYSSKFAPSVILSTPLLINENPLSLCIRSFAGVLIVNFKW